MIRSFFRMNVRLPGDNSGLVQSHCLCTILFIHLTAEKCKYPTHFYDYSIFHVCYSANIFLPQFEGNIDVIGIEVPPFSHKSVVREHYKMNKIGSDDGQDQRGLPGSGDHKNQPIDSNPIFDIIPVMILLLPCRIELHGYSISH